MMGSPWPFASVWQLVKDFAQINAGNDHREYPIHSVAVDPSTPDPRQNQENPHARHKLLEGLWSTCFHVCEEYVDAHSPGRAAPQQCQAPQLEKLVSNLCYQLRPEWDPELPINEPSQPVLTASFQAASRAVSLLVGNGKAPDPGTGLVASTLHFHLDLVSNLWDLRQQRRAQYTEPHPNLPPPTCGGDDLWLRRDDLGDHGADGSLVVYQCYNRSYTTEIEALLTSLHALLFHIIARSRSPQFQACDTNEADNERQQNVTDVKLCWAVCESLQALTYRTTVTKEGWITYGFRKDPEAGLKISRIRGPKSFIRWQPNPWGNVSGLSQPQQLNRACKDENTEILLQPSLEVPLEVNETGSDLTQDVASVATGSIPQSTLARSRPANPASITWAELLAPSRPQEIAKPVPLERPSSGLGGGTISVSGSDAGPATTCDCNCPALFPQDLDDLHHIRLRILLRTAAIQHGWHKGHGMSLRDFVREEMSPTSFGKSEKRRKLFADYRNAILNPQNNIKDRGDTAAHEGTVAQIQRAVQWRTLDGKHQFLKQLFQAVTGRELGQVDEDCDQVIVA